MIASDAGTLSSRVAGLQTLTAPVVEFLTRSTWAQHQADPDIADFVVGNPHEPPLPGFVSALKEQLEPRRDDWFAYQMNDPLACEAVAGGLRARLGAPFAAEDVLLTTGAFAGLSVALRTLVDAGDEVLFLSPPWFFYEALIAAEGGVPVRVKARPPTFALDAEAIAEAMTPRTRAVIVNSPNNPTGRIYSAAELRALAGLLEAASRTNGRRIYLLSDEAYSRIVFSGERFESPTAFYPWSILVYTYGKTLLAPGQRMGYLALPPSMPALEREALRAGLLLSQVVTGYAFPNALLQHALPMLEGLSIDVSALERRRDRVVSALSASGYEVGLPQATFYLLPKVPGGDDLAFVERLAEHGVYVLPGAVVELPGYFRMSLTASDAMVERALPVFAALA
jgi:aspartate aminotransferase